MEGVAEGGVAARCRLPPALLLLLPALAKPRPFHGPDFLGFLRSWDLPFGRDAAAAAPLQLKLYVHGGSPVQPRPEGHAALSVLSAQGN